MAEEKPRRSPSQSRRRRRSIDSQSSRPDPGRASRTRKLSPAPRRKEPVVEMPTRHPVVFWTSATVIIGLVLVAAILMHVGWFVEVKGEAVPGLRHFFLQLQAGISARFGWLFVAAVNLYLVVALYFMFSRHGRLKLGGPDEKPEFSYWSWLAMLFSAGMGIGLLFYSVAEPIYHFQAPPLGEGGTPGAAGQAMAITLFHWGFHAWGVYALVGLALAFFSFRRGLPLTIRSAFHPVLGDRIHGPIGNTVDILAVVATLFGVATSLGLGVQQVYAGLDYVLGVGRWAGDGAGRMVFLVLLIAIITGMATTSVVLGLDRGIRRLSELTMVLAGLLLLAVFLLGPTSFLLDALLQNAGLYLQNMLWLSTWSEAYTHTNWQDSWTIFYWAWWIAWSPFVGMFIARISRGRTIREFVGTVLLVPTLLTLVWLTVFGGSALRGELDGNTAVSTAMNNDVATALFALLDGFPLASFTSLVAIVVVVVFFVTSSDSGSLVIDIITAGGHPDPPVGQRIFWAVLEGVVAATLLVAGGLRALQTASITTGLPFAVVLIFMVWSLARGIREETQRTEAGRPSRGRPGRSGRGRARRPATDPAAEGGG